MKCGFHPFQRNPCCFYWRFGLNLIRPAPDGSSWWRWLPWNVTPYKPVLAKLWLFCDPGAGFYWFIQSVKKAGEKKQRYRLGETMAIDSGLQPLPADSQLTKLSLAIRILFTRWGWASALRISRVEIPLEPDPDHTGGGKRRSFRLYLPGKFLPEPPSGGSFHSRSFLSES